MRRSRALPEGVAAMLARLMSALSSRELTLLTRAVVRGAAGLLANSRNTADLLRRICVPRKVRVCRPRCGCRAIPPRCQG